MINTVSSMASKLNRVKENLRAAMHIESHSIIKIVEKRFYPAHKQQQSPVEQKSQLKKKSILIAMLLFTACSRDFAKLFLVS